MISSPMECLSDILLLLTSIKNANTVLENKKAGSVLEWAVQSEQKKENSMLPGLHKGTGMGLGKWVERAQTSKNYV